jgi:hypothetical protein
VITPLAAAPALALSPAGVVVGELYATSLYRVAA